MTRSHPPLGARLAKVKDRILSLDRKEIELKFRLAAMQGNLTALSMECGRLGYSSAIIGQLVDQAQRALRNSTGDTAVLPRPAIAICDDPAKPHLLWDQSQIEAARMRLGIGNDVPNAEVAAREIFASDPDRLPGRFGNRFRAASVEDNPLRETGLVDGFLAWLKGPLVLQSPHRCAHKAIAAMGITLTTYSGEDKKSVLRKSKVADEASLQVIMVDHDWAALFGASSQDGAGGEWHLPFELQVFEFAISGAAVIAAINADPVVTSLAVGIRPPGLKSWISDRCGVRVTGDKWTLVTNLDLPGKGEPAVNAAFDRLYNFILAQVRATSIMLDSEVAVIEAVRAPYNTNAPPKDRKPLPALSHHVVRLNRRPRVAPAAEPAGPARHGVRLHFRRGHWRHYANHKTWIKWMLVGDPDLGFVEHEYRI